ncbi:MAG: SDR family NAD(P)-dependent oxidoreductase [Alphaproteobacteria bacterium]|nr:SDR family NAD(P)-dependent oxidoreductase [Alphaproteobacteria bacterium]
MKKFYDEAAVCSDYSNGSVVLNSRSKWDAAGIEDNVKNSKPSALSKIASSIDFRGNTVVATGVADGIGAAVAQGVIFHGGNVIGVDVQGDKLEALKDTYGKAFWGIEKDLSEPMDSSFKTALEEACRHYKGVDAYFLNAGVQKIADWKQAATLVTTPVEEFLLMAQINVWSHQKIFNVLFPWLRDADSPRLVATSSAVVGRTDPKMAAYIQTKGMLLKQVAFMGQEIKNESIPDLHVNAWMPPPVQTFLRADYKGSEPFGANALPADNVGVPLALLSKSCSINGQTIIVGDKREAATTENGTSYEFNKRTGTGFNFDIGQCNLGDLTAVPSSVVARDYDTGRSRQLLGVGPAPAIDAKRPLNKVFQKPPHMTDLRARVA